MIAALRGRLAWVVLAGTGAALVLETWLGVQARTEPLPVVLGHLAWNDSFIAFGVVGALAARRAPANAVGWLLLAAGFLLANASLAQQLPVVLADPAATWSDWFGTWLWVLAPGCLQLAVLLFPNGRFLSNPWRRFAALIVATWVLLAAASALGPDLLDGRANPAAAPFLRQVAPALTGARLVVFVATTLGAAASIFQRWRAAGGVERLQLKWFLLGATLLPLLVAAGSGAQAASGQGQGGQILLGVANAAAMLALPAALGVAMLRHRLFDIDVVISRGLVYGLLGAGVTVTYLTITTLAGLVVGRSGGGLLFALVATGLAAVAFQPARTRLEAAVNRLVYGSRTAPEQILRRLATRLADATAPEHALEGLARELVQATSARSVVIWAGDGHGAHLIDAWPDGLGLAKDGMVVPIVHQGSQLGAMTIRDDPKHLLGPATIGLLNDVGAQLGLILANLRLTHELEARLLDLQEASRRLVSAQEAERRRLERDLHDGAQQYLVELRLKLGLAKDALPVKATVARQLLDEARRGVAAATDSLRTLARGLVPRVLADEGLVAALRDLASRSPLPLRIETDGIVRYAPVLEAIVYLCCSEAIINAAKHSAAKQVRLRLSQQGGEIAFVVEDDGCGFDPPEIVNGMGLQNIRDRLSAAGGRLDIVSAPGRGTAIQGWVPVSVRAPVG